MQPNLRLKERLPPKVFPQKLAKKPLPTMYDLPSENPEDPGLPDTFHIHQPQLLRETFHPPDYSPENFFEASDLNLYYDLAHEKWYKRPDWFAVLGVPSLYEKRDMRYSYVIWKEKITPVIVVELLSEDTEKEDLGKTLREIRKPPTKWQVYEQILQIPYYVVFSREKPDKFQIFQNQNGRYHALTLSEKRCWFPKIQLGLGVWDGTYYNIKHQWLRWYDAKGQWIPTLQEREELAKTRVKEEAQARLAEKQRADAAEAELIRLKALLAQKGLSE
jgi:Uma2 family endonuclease